MDLSWYDTFKLPRDRPCFEMLRACRTTRLKTALDKVPKSDGVDGAEQIHGEFRGSVRAKDAMPEGSSNLCDNGQDLSEAG